MILIKAAATLIVNFIIYFAFGSFFEVKNNRKWSPAIAVTVGFFAYYALFAVFCLPVMFTYRPLSFLAKIWAVTVGLVVLASVIIHVKAWRVCFYSLAADIKKNRTFYLCVLAVTAVFVLLAVITYTFTLDASYYVAGVATNVDTDMINVYDPFTGNWLDHFELRYVFATYYANDAVVCRITHLPALVETKGVMAAAVMIIVNILYAKVCTMFFEERTRALLMYALMSLINCTFISLYTASNFLMSRTYEGKSIVANMSVIMIFVLYMMVMESKEEYSGLFIKLFIVCLGSATVSSTANMVIPAEAAILFLPCAFLRKKASIAVKAFLCITPEIVMMLMYVLYVKGYYAIYTYPR